MQSVVENLGPLSRKVKVTVPQQQVDDEIEKRIQDLAKNPNLSLKGFRKGKIHISAIKIQYGPAIRQEVIQDLIWKTLQQAFQEQKLSPATPPKVELINIASKGPLEFEASFEIFPEVKLNLEEISIEKPTTVVQETHITEVIEKLRHQNAKWKEVDRAAQKADKVVIDFEGFIEGEAFEGGKAEDFNLELGQGAMIPGFEDVIYGAKAGDSLEAKVVFPQDYHAKQYAGKPATFNITLKKVMEPELPELNDHFASDLGITTGTLAGLQEEVRRNLETELDRRIREKIKVQLIDQLLEKNNIEVPQGSIEQEIDRLQKQMDAQLSQYTGKKVENSVPRSQFEDQARRNVILGLLLSQWIKDNDLKVDTNRVRDRIDQIASGYHQPHEIVNWYYGNKEALEDLQASVLEDQAIDKILEMIKVTEKEMAFDELMQLGNAKGE